jgi:Putative phage tail protein
MSGGTTISTSATKIEALQLQSSAYGVPITVTYGLTRASGNLLWYNGFKATAHTTSQSQGGKGGGGVTSQSTTYTYSSCVMMGLCEGAITGVPRIWKGKTVFGDAATTALAQLGLSLATGAVAQATWPYLTTSYASQAIGYSGLAYVYAQDYALDTNAALDNHSFEIQGLGAYAVAGVPDANPATIAADLLTNARYGAGYPSAKLASMTNWSDYCLAANILLSPAFDTQVQASEVITSLAQITNTAPIWTTGGLKMVPYGDTTITGNGATYTPNLTPVYDLNDDDFIAGSDGSDPIKVERKPQSDAFNCVHVEFLNRGVLDTAATTAAGHPMWTAYYNTEVATAEDSANIDAYGRRVAPTVQAHWICDAVVAQNVAQLVLQRLLYIRNSYHFNLPWTKVLLEPMDLVTLTDSGLGYNKLAVRLVDVGESEVGDLDVVAEDFPQGIAHAAANASQSSAGFQHNYAALPGSVSTPMFFEAPVERTTTGLEVYAAVIGLGANWGGCRVWVSYDGTNYKAVQYLYGGARYGALTGAVSAGNLPVAIKAGQLISGSAADAANLSTLCYIGGANPEYLAYTTAALTGANAYTLSGLNRSAFTTSGAAHAASDPFARIDDAIAKSGPMDLSMIGKTVYFKFTSFNIYNAAEESLAAVTAFPYVITGAMANLPPPPFDNFLILVQPDGTRQFNFSYATASPVDWMGAEIRYIGGTTATPDWNAMQPLQDTATFYTHSPVEANQPLAGVYTFAIKSVDLLSNLSSYVVRNVTLPDRRLGNVFDEFFEGTDGWLGTKTGCQIINGILESIDSTTWATAPATWAAFARWNTTPTSPITYVSPVRNFGTQLAAQVNAAVDADGTILLEIATSADNITWSAWGSASSPFSTRYLKIRLTVTANGTYPVPVVRSFNYQINAPLKTEYIDNLVLSSLTGVYRIGVGDIRIPLAGTYSLLKRTTPTIQDSTAGTWVATRIDNTLSPSPRWQFRLNGTLADPAFVDFYIEGI